MMDQFAAIIDHLFVRGETGTPLSDLDIISHFQPDKPDPVSIARTINAAFLILVSDRQDSVFEKAQTCIKNLANQEAWSGVVAFYLSGIELIKQEITNKHIDDLSFRQKINNLYSKIATDTKQHRINDTIETIWHLFFPEGNALLNPETRAVKIAELREKRTVTISQLNPSPIANPAKEILFTSNILLTVPFASMPIDRLQISDALKLHLHQIVQENQLFWYDHPIPIGIDTAKNEAVYGLSGLSEMLQYEIASGNAPKNTRLNCLLSVSVTHAGLHKIAKEYLHQEFHKTDRIKNLHIYLFTEEETTALINDILYPIAQKFMDIEGDDLDLLKLIIGVDGEYGRHFSFLKAIAAFWQVMIDANIKATYKIDLDQIFPQEKLIAQTGKSAFNHFKTPLWGAKGIDFKGDQVELGMIAGAVVNEADIEKSLFYPDVPFPQNHKLNPDELVFFSRLPQALSTEAEMMTRYNTDAFSNHKRAVSRIHILGGMSGILIEALRKYKPFTPTFIGRAEDQAYLLSVLFKEQPYMRCLHASGLIMRHDKQAFVGDVLEAAEIGKTIGDFTRILLYSFYARALPCSVDNIKEQVDPFTGCFISHIPFTVIYLRFALKAASFFSHHEAGEQLKGLAFLKNGSRRLHARMRQLTEDPASIKKQYQQERKAWDLYYAILDMAEQKLKQGDPFAQTIRDRAWALIAKCKI
jgi:hypothetical protein